MSRKSVPLVLVCLCALLGAVPAHALRRSLAASPTAIDFGSLTVGAFSEQTVTLTSNGVSNVKVSAITSSSADFLVSAPGLPVVLVPGASVSFTVKFLPLTAGAKSGSITVSASALNAPVIAVQGSAAVPPPPPPSTTDTTTYGNVGDPYEGVTPGSAVMLAACQVLMPNTSYRLSGNVSALTATDVCFTFTGSGTTLDLNGYRVTGRIVANAVDINGTHLFNGSVQCDRDGSLGGNVGCILLYGDYYTPKTQLRVHHLNIANTAACGRSLHLEWSPSTSALTVPYAVRLYNITSVAPSGPTCSRTYNFGAVTTDPVSVEANNNDLTCPADAGACQGISFYGNDHSRMHHNRAQMPQNTSVETGRAFICDGHADYCELDHNLVIANNNRAFRVRDSAHARVHDNAVQRVTCCGVAAVHLADPDTGSNDLDAIVENNTFEVVDGTVLFVRSGYNAWFRNNTLNCAGCSGTSNLATVRAGATTSVVLENNPTATALGTPQIFVEAGTSATLCNSGSATGAGTITYTTACQP